MSEIFDKFKEKAKDVKDAVVDATKDVEEETNIPTDPSLNTSSSNLNDREYEDGTAGTNRNRQ